MIKILFNPLKEETAKVIIPLQENLWMSDRERDLLSNDNDELNVQMGIRQDCFMIEVGDSIEPPEGRIYMSIDKKYFATLWVFGNYKVENTSPGIR